MRVYPTRPAVFRLACIDRAIRGSSPATAASIAKGIEVSSRTIQRDIEFMRDVLGAPIEWDPKKGKYRYTREGYALPSAAMSEGELLSVLVGSKVLTQYAGTPFEADLRRAFDRISVLLPEEVHVRIGELAEATSFSITAPRPTELETFQRLTKAVRERSRLRIEYESLSGGRTSFREVDPYRMACLDGAWYLVAFCRVHGDVRMFVPERIRKIEETGRRFPPPRGFDFEAYMSGAFKVMRGKKPVRVRLEFHGMTARYVCERRWHATQEVSWRGDACVLEMTVSALPEVASWVMGFGGECRVLAPDSLRRMVLEGHRHGMVHQRSTAGVKAARPSGSPPSRRRRRET